MVANICKPEVHLWHTTMNCESHFFGTDAKNVYPRYINTQVHVVFYNYIVLFSVYGGKL